MSQPTRRTLLVPTAVALAVAAPVAWAFTVSPSNIARSLGDGEMATDEICVDVPADAVVPKVDVYLLADTTGSMGSIINTLKTGATTVVSDLYTDLGADGIDVRIGIGNYKDFPFDSYAFDHQLDPADEVDEANVLTAISGWFASGGFDGSEGQLFALDRLAHDIDPAGGDIGWRNDAKKIIVWFGDAPGHDAVCAAISGLGYDVTESSVTDDLVDEDFTVIAISTTTGYVNALNDNPTLSAFNYTSACGTPGGSSGQANRISDATGGSHTSGVNATTIVDTIIDTVTDSAGEIGSLGLDIGAALLPYVDSFDGPATNIDTSVDSQHCFDVNWLGDCGDGVVNVLDGISVVADGADVGSVGVDLTLSSCSSCPNDAGNLGTANGYNLFVMGAFSGSNADIEGAAAIGGNASFNHYGINSGGGSGTVLSVGGNLSMSHSQIYGGDGEVAGTCTTSHIGTPAGTLTCNHAGTFDAGDHTAEMNSLSDHLANLAANGTTTTTTWGGVYLTGTDAHLNVFELDLDALGFAGWVWNGWINTFQIDVPHGSTTVVNVLGNTDPLFKNGGFNLIGATNGSVVWNYNTQTSVEIRNVTVPGSLIAPHATVNFNNGNIDGTLIAWDASGQGEYHDYTFMGDICP